LARSSLKAPFVVAGNKMVSGQARSILEASGKFAVVEDNVLPELDQLNVEPTRSRIREIFMNRITQAKGLDKANALVGGIVMPTPMAVLKGAALLADGCQKEPGLGPLVVVDVGGATTDVHSVAVGQPTQPNVLVKGLPEPYQKRTVEGDLGIRYNALSILEMTGLGPLLERMTAFDSAAGKNLDLAAKIERLARDTDFVPSRQQDLVIDLGLAQAAVDLAMQRHAGKVREAFFAYGKAKIQRGKDLTRVGSIIGTGGVFAHGKAPFWVLEAAAFSPKRPESLRPLEAQLFIDKEYILFAMGLLADVSPLAALNIMKKQGLKTGHSRRRALNMEPGAAG